MRSFYETFTWRLPALVIGLILFSLSLTHASESKTTGFSDKVEKKDLTLAFFIPRREPFWDANVRYARAAASNLGVGFKLVVFQDDPAELLENLEMECRQGIDGVIFPAFSNSGEDALRIAEKYRTPAFIINAGLKEADFPPRTKYRYWVGVMTPDDLEVGAKLINQLLEQARRSGVDRFHILGIEGRPDQEASILRRRGLEIQLKYAEGVESFTMVAGDWDPAKAAAAFRKQFAEDPALNIVWCANDNMALAVADAAGEVGASGKLFIGGVDWDPRIMKAISEKRVRASVGGHYFEGAWAVLMMHDYLKGRDFAAEGLEFTTSMPTITHYNLGAFKRFLSLDPDDIDFRLYSKAYNPVRLEYKFDLEELADHALDKAGASPSSSISLTPKEKDWLAAHPSITMAIMSAWPPFNVEDAQGKAEGIGVDYLKILGMRLGVEFKIIPGPFPDNLAAVREKRIDALMDVTPKPDRAEYLYFTKPYMNVPHVFVGRLDGPYYENEKQLAGKILALEKGFGNVRYFKRNFPEITVIEYPDTEACLAAVSQGRADAYAGNRAAAAYIITQKLLTNLGIQGKLNKPGSILAIGVRKDWPQLAVLLDKALDSIVSSEQQTILRRWTGIRGLDYRASLTPEEEDWVRTHPVVDTAAAADYRPFNFLDDSGSYTGIAVEMLKAAAERLGFEIKPEFGTLSDGLDAVASGRLDLAPTVQATSKLRDHLVLTDPFLIVPHVLAVQKGSRIRSAEDLAGKILAVESSGRLSDFVRKNIPDVKMLEAGTVLDALKAVDEGKADACLGDKLQLDYLIGENQLPSLTVIPFPEVGPLELSMAVRPDWKPMVSILEKGLATLTPLERREINRRFMPIKKDDGKKLTLTEDEKNWLKSHPEFMTSFNRDWAPFEFVDDDGEYSGIASEFISRLENILGIRLVPYTGLDLLGALEAAEKREVDVIPAIAAGGEGGDFLLFTKPYARIPLVIVTRKDAVYVDDLDKLGPGGAALDKTCNVQGLIERDHPRLKLLSVDSPEEALTAASEGRVEAAVVNLASFTYLAAKLDMDDLKVAAPTPYTFDLSFAVRADLPELASVLDKALASIPEKDKAVFQEHWINLRVERHVDWALVLSMGLAAGLVVALILTIIIRSNRRLAREVKERAMAEQKIQAMSSAIHDALIMIDAEAKVMYWNQAAEGLLGFTAEQAMGKDMHGLFAPPDLWEKAQKGLAQFARTGGGPVLDKLLELTAVRADGVRVPVEVAVSAFKVGDDWYAVGTVRDITERKKIEEQIKAAREELLLIFDNSQVGIMFMVGDCRLARINRRLSEILGYDDPREMINFGMEDLHLSEENFQAFREHNFKYLTQGKQSMIEYRLKRKSGEAVWCSMSGKAVDPSVLPDLNKGVIWVVDDITQRRLAEELLVESQKRLDLALTASNTGLWDWRPLEGEDYHNDQWYRQLGYEPGELRENGDHLMELMHPDDAVGFNKNMERYTAGQTDEYSQEFRMRAKDGSWKWILSLGKVTERDEKGRTRRIVGVHLDMTERKIAEQELKQNIEELERFSRLVVGRELKMIELKQEVNELLKQSGGEGKYKIVA